MSLRYKRNIKKYQKRRAVMTITPSNKIKNIVRREVDAELKFRDLDIAFAPIPTVTGSVTNITLGIDQGNLNTNRSGNWIKPTTFMGKIVVTADDNNGAISTQYRCMVVCWKEDESTNPLTLAKLMQDTSEPHQGYNIANKGQFQVLKSWTGVLSNHNQNSKVIQYHTFYLKPKMKVLYSAANAKNNQLFICAFSQFATGQNPAVFRFSTRLRYTDS